MARTKKKVTETIEKTEEIVQKTISTRAERMSKKKASKVEPEADKEIIEKPAKKNNENSPKSNGNKKTNKTRKSKTPFTKEGSDDVSIEEKIESVINEPIKTRKKKSSEQSQEPKNEEFPVAQNNHEPKKRSRKKKEVEESKPVVIDNTPTKKTRKSKKDDKPKLSAVPPEKVEDPKEEKIVEAPKKEWKPPVKTKDFYEFEDGKYVLGDVEELFDEAFTKKVKISVKKSSKNNHGKDDKLGIYYFKVNEKVWDLIEYNSKILTTNKALILCKSELITKEGKLRFCRRFESKEKFRVYPEYTKDDYCLFFYNIDSPSPFIMLQDENLV